MPVRACRPKREKLPKVGRVACVLLRVTRALAVHCSFRLVSPTDAGHERRNNERTTHTQATAYSLEAGAGSPVLLVHGHGQRQSRRPRRRARARPAVALSDRTRQAGPSQSRRPRRRARARPAVALSDRRAAGGARGPGCALSPGAAAGSSLLLLLLLLRLKNICQHADAQTWRAVTVTACDRVRASRRTAAPRAWGIAITLVHLSQQIVDRLSRRDFVAGDPTDFRLSSVQPNPREQDRIARDLIDRAFERMPFSLVRKLAPCTVRVIPPVNACMCCHNDNMARKGNVIHALTESESSGHRARCEELLRGLYRARWA